MKRFSTIILSVFLFATMAMAEDIVYLNNGNVIKGNVIKDDGINVEVESNGNTLTYKKLEVRKIDKGTSSVVEPSTPKRAAYIDYSNEKKGWWCAVELMGGGSVDLNYNPNFYNVGISFINGYRFNQFIQIGVGVGFRYYITTKNSYYTENFPGDLYKENGNPILEPKASAGNNDRYPVDRNGNLYKGSPWAIPLFIDIRGNFITNDTRSVVPYWAFDLGYSFSGNYLKGLKVDDMRRQDWSYDNSDATPTMGDGIFFAPTLGIKVGTPRHNFLVGLTYMGQVLPRWSNPGMNADNPVSATLTTRYTSFMCGKIAYEF